MDNLQQLVEMGRELQAKMAELESSLDSLEVEASAGGGMVTAKVDGRGRLKGIRLDAKVVDPSDVEMLEDLITAAVSEAQHKAQRSQEERMRQLTGGLPLPGGFPGLL
ncbi:MAG: YbaB/EbfC family nucleoid-associated protein [Gemmatimonadota bacterium]